MSHSHDQLILILILPTSPASLHALHNGNESNFNICKLGLHDIEYIYIYIYI